MFIQKVGGTKGLNSLIDMMKDDVKSLGGTVSMTVDMSFGSLWDITVSSFPLPRHPERKCTEILNGLVVIRKPTDNLEASLEWLRSRVEREFERE
jgi:hypothetical protein